MWDKVRATPGSIGYAEVQLAQRASLRIARIKNAAGEFVKPTEKTIATAASEAKIVDDFRVSLTNAVGKESYPISSFTWGFTFRRRRRTPIAVARWRIISTGFTPMGRRSRRIRVMRRCRMICW